MTPAHKSAWIKKIAREAGFDGAGVAPAVRPGGADHYRQWLAEGRAGRMDYLRRHVEHRTDARLLLPGARSVIVVSHNYHRPAPPEPADGQPRGRIAMYAWGRDYHRVVRKKLNAMIDRMRETLDEPFEARACVDTAPLLEREFAAAAGIGWIGRNTMVLDRKSGSYFVLGEIVTTLDLEYDEPVEDRCGQCTRCVDACPTGALDHPYRMDASRCISYLTIELRDEVPEALQPHMGNWVYGCDICQAVCPYNRKAPVTAEADYAIREPAPYPLLTDLLSWSRSDYGEKLTGSAMKRATLVMLQRNAKIAMDNLQRRRTR